MKHSENGNPSCKFGIMPKPTEVENCSNYMYILSFGAQFWSIWSGLFKVKGLEYLPQ
jgi:hypothetical protein